MQILLTGMRLLIFFRNGEVKITDMRELAGTYADCRPYISREERFNTVEVQPDGYGVFWSERAMISDQALYEKSQPVPLALKDFIGFVQRRVVSSSEACRILDCSRQNIDDLIKRGKLHPIRQDARNKLFLRNEITQRKQQS